MPLGRSTSSRTASCTAGPASARRGASTPAWRRRSSSCRLAPLHHPAALAWIRACRDGLGVGVEQVAVFDTAFHAGLPAAAATYALPHGIGENAPAVRSRILDGFAWAGLALDDAANMACTAGCGREARISRADSRVQAWVIPVDEAHELATQALSIRSKT